MQMTWTSTARIVMKTLRKYQKLLSAFCETSGLKVNYDKTTIYRVGSYKNTDPKQYTKNVRVTTSGLNILGVWIENDKVKMMKENYDPLMDSVKAIYETWYNRNISLLGKVTVVNTLVLSLFVYKMSALPIIPKYVITQFTKLTEKFIWNGKRPKIPLAKLQNARNQGGLNLVNLELKDKSLKVSWIPYLAQDEDMAKLAYNALNYALKEKIWSCNIKSLDIKTMFNSHNFWIDVLNSWSEYNYDDEPVCLEGQIIWYNSLI